MKMLNKTIALLACLSMIGTISANAERAKIKVILDADPGVDDAMAIAFAEASDKIDLIGITTVWGNATLENCNRNALLMKEMFGLKADIVSGADTPLVGEPSAPADFVHGKNGLGDIPIEDRAYGKLDGRTAHDYIIEKINANPGEITLIAVGRLTNLARALEKDPSIAQRVKEVIIMGGAFGYYGHTGNVTPFAEANIIGDPHAADIVMTADWPVTVVGLDVTMEIIASNTYLAELGEASKTYGAFIYEITRFYAEFYKNAVNIDGCAMHDAAAVVYAVAPELFTVRKGPIRVVTEGPAFGHTMQKETTRWYPVDPWADFRAQTVCIGADSAGVLELYRDTLIAAEK